MPNKFYITTPLYYVNASPHIGHSYTTIAADCLARCMRRLIGEDRVLLLTGTDEYGQKIQRAALAQGLNPKEFVDLTVVQFKELWKILNISYNDFIRTTEERHTKTVQRVLGLLFEKKQIYSAKYEGWYCTPCETFWTQTQLEGLVCPDCLRPLEKINETNWFFKLSEHQKWLMEYIKEQQGFIKPASRYEEVLRFLELNKLEDLCISRPKERLSWGISLPFSQGHVTYVWFDALINYISAVGSFDSQGKYESKWWPADLHLIGKDILRQHAVYWPIMLHVLGLELPKAIFAHGWWLAGGQDKMSKSRGNAVNPINIVDKFGVDTYRYFLLRDVPFGLDGSFSEEAIIKRYNSDLANDLGNLVYRTLTMIEKYFGAEIPQSCIIVKSAAADALEKKINNLATITAGIIDCNFSLTLEGIWELINITNKYIEDTRPWNLYKENKTDELKEFILVLVKALREVAHQIYPFIPQTSEAIIEQLGLPRGPQLRRDAGEAAGKDKIKKGSPLFPRIN